jgi:hypothetical protein
MSCVRFCLLAGAIALSGCASRAPLTGQAQADAATRSACRQRAEAAYNQQNRGDIYSPASQVNSPFSGNFLPDKTDRGLSQLFTHDEMVSNCVRNSGTGEERTPPRPITQP